MWGHFTDAHIISTTTQCSAVQRSWVGGPVSQWRNARIPSSHSQSSNFPNLDDDDANDAGAEYADADDADGVFDDVAYTENASDYDDVDADSDAAMYAGSLA